MKDPIVEVRIAVSAEHNGKALTLLDDLLGVFDKSKRHVALDVDTSIRHQLAKALRERAAAERKDGRERNVYESTAHDAGRLGRVRVPQPHRGEVVLTPLAAKVLAAASNRVPFPAEVTLHLELLSADIDESGPEPMLVVVWAPRFNAERCPGFSSTASPSASMPLRSAASRKRSSSAISAST